MQEKVLRNKKNGMAVLLLSILLYLAAIVGFVFGCILVEDGASAASLLLLIVCAVWLLVGWIPFLGLKVLKPQEALVLTLFGKYVGTLKSDGFYYVNPFCTGVNPAAKTHLSQSGDVDGAARKSIVLAAQAGANVEFVNKKNLPENHDPQQQPAEDQRLPG